MRTNKLVKEIIENNPEFKKDEKKLEKIIDKLVKNNPEIKVDDDFKKNLRNRLDAIANMKEPSEKKVFFYAGLLQVFSMLFVVAGFYYYLGGTEFFHTNKDITPNLKIEPRIEKIEPKIETFDENSSDAEISTFSDEIIDVKIDNIDEESSEKNESNKIEKMSDDLDNSNVNTNTNDQVQPKLLKTTRMLKEDIQETKELPKLEPANMSIESLSDESENNNTYNVIEDTQITDMLGEPEGSSDIDEESYSLKGIAPAMIDADLIESDDSMMEDSLIEDFSLENLDDGLTNSGTSTTTYEKLDFTDFCKSNLGQIINIGGENICIVDQKRCFESDYKDGDCNFVEIK